MSTNLSSFSTAVKPQFAPAPWLVADPDAGHGADLAFRWGEEDSLEGNDMQGSAYFPIDSPAWRSYNEGYAAGLVLRKALAQSSELDEIAFMELSLEAFKCKPLPVQLVLSDEIDADAAEEWIGNAFSTEPYLF